MSRSVTISTCGFGRARGIRRGRGAGAGGAVSAAGPGEAVSSSHQTTLPAGSWVGYQSQRALRAATRSTPSLGPASPGSLGPGGRGSASQTSMRTRVPVLVLVPARFTDTVWPGWPVALTALVTSSDTRSSALSTREFSPHSHRRCLTCRQAQDAAVGRAPSSRELRSGHGSVIACYLRLVGDVARSQHALTISNFATLSSNQPER